MNSNPVCVTTMTIGEEGNGKPPHKVHFSRGNLRTLSTVAAKLEIEYVTHQSIDISFSSAVKEMVKATYTFFTCDVLTMQLRLHGTRLVVSYYFTFHCLLLYHTV